MGTAEMIGTLIGLSSPIWIMFLIILGVLGFLMPFFILKIRNQVVEMNKNLTIIVNVLGKDHWIPQKLEYLAYNDSWWNKEAKISGIEVERLKACGFKIKENK